MALLYRLVTLPEGTLRISTLKVTPTTGTVDYGDELQITVVTENGTDSQGYAATSRDLDIARLVNTTSIPDENGVGIFTVNPGDNAGGKDGTTIIDITGINTGARKEVTINVSASGAIT